MSRNHKHRGCKNFTCGGSDMCPDCIKAERISTILDTAKKLTEKYHNTLSRLHDCECCGDLKVIWIDMWETNCPKCSPVKE